MVAVPRRGVKGKLQPKGVGLVPSQLLPPECLGEEEMNGRGVQNTLSLSEQLLLGLEPRGSISCPLRRGWKSNVYPGRVEAAFPSMP